MTHNNRIYVNNNPVRKHSVQDYQFYIMEDSECLNPVLSIS